MAISIAHLGPTGTNAETATLAYQRWLEQKEGKKSLLCPYPTIAKTLYAVAYGETQQAVVPVENSTEGTVAIIFDSLWQLDKLKIQQELVLPISHALLSRRKSLKGLKTVYSHPQALAQCQHWLEQNLPSVSLIPTNSTTEALHQIDPDSTSAAIASPRAAKLYNFPILINDINDYPDNCTRFWILELTPTTIEGSRISLGFSVPDNVPGTLVKPLEVFAKRGINLSRIESRPTKRSLGEYLFFIDLEINSEFNLIEEALAELRIYTETLKVFGGYRVLSLKKIDVAQF
ncbi:MAG: prephenate dehydratase [cyanobacterium endosymbiont of Rhopalodia musculus]|uniref:prephenate dehydratase n=1 Tax=cyanobacterium endosymbiont of Epithemia clementina EcSB TaxID=3034674 RepID=UPI00248167F5|nr:prephenate dehydratase [cyanobacterium endosymbiont of Epithemia clementina EcSB]WGT68343.1 prephenate dehydratase [cyanobacterium endosymbiont of Epithemia clementina EcSB]